MKKVLLIASIMFFVSTIYITAAERQKFMYKQKSDFNSLGAQEVRDGQEFLSVMVKCIDCTIFDSVVNELERDGWSSRQPRDSRSVGTLWVDSTNQIDVFVENIPLGAPYDLNSFVDALNRKLFFSGNIVVSNANEKMLTSLYKKITNFKVYGEYYVPETVDGYQYLRLDIVADEQIDNFKNKEIQAAHANIVHRLQGKLTQSDGKLGWKKGRRGNNVAVIQLYYEEDTLNVQINIFNGKMVDLRYREDCKKIKKYLSRYIRQAGHTGIVDGVYQK
jgi:hypothetical protein